MADAAVLTISDSVTAGTRADRSGPAVRERLEQLGWRVPVLEAVPDDAARIGARLAALADGGQVAAIFTTGGTGLAARDITPEATRGVLDREIPGFGELMRSEGRRSTPLAALSRSLAGTPTWEKLSPGGAIPAARAWHSVIYDSAHERMVVFGGCNGFAPSYRRLSDVWALSLSGSPSWTMLVTPVPGVDAPDPLFAHSAVYDAARDRMVVCGGDAGWISSDVWALSLDSPPAWTSIVPVGQLPLGRVYHSAIYDPVRDRMVVFGGTSGYSNDVCALSLAGTPAWTQLASSGTPPFARDFHTAVYDP